MNKKTKKNLDGDATGTPDRVQISLVVVFVIVTEHQQLLYRGNIKMARAHSGTQTQMVTTHESSDASLVHLAR